MKINIIIKKMTEILEGKRGDRGEMCLDIIKIEEKTCFCFWIFESNLALSGATNLYRR